jgi:integrase
MGVTLRERKLPSGNTQLYLDIHRYVAKGEYERHTEALFVLKKGEAFDNREKRRMAQEIRSKRSLDLDAQAHGISSTQKRTANFIRYFEEQAELRRGNTARNWKNALEHFRTFAGERLTFAELNPTLFEKFKAYLLKDISPNSAQIYLARVKSTLNQAVRDGILVGNPAQSVKIKGEATLPVFLELDELNKLNKTKCRNDQIKQAFFFACFTGMRYSDVSRLTWASINGDSIKYQQKKTGKDELILITEEAGKILKKQRKEEPSRNLVREFSEDIVFFLPSQPVVDKRLKQWAKDAGLAKRLSFHKARHTFAMIARRKGIPMHTIKGLLGHESERMTEKYARLDELEKRKAAKKFPTLS